MTAAYDYEDLHHLVDRLTPAQARRLRRLVTQDEELSRTAAGDAGSGQITGLLALIGSVTGPPTSPKRTTGTSQDGFRSRTADQA